MCVGVQGGSSSTPLGSAAGGGHSTELRRLRDSVGVLRAASGVGCNDSWESFDLVQLTAAVASAIEVL